VIFSPSISTTGFSTMRPATTSSIAAARTALRAGGVGAAHASSVAARTAAAALNTASTFNLQLL